MSIVTKISLILKAYNISVKSEETFNFILNGMVRYQQWLLVQQSLIIYLPHTLKNLLIECVHILV